MTVVNMFVMRYFDSIVNWVKEIGTKNDYFQDLVHGLALGLVLSVIVILYENTRGAS